jgi:hypothetical protein
MTTLLIGFALPTTRILKTFGKALKELRTDINWFCLANYQNIETFGKALKELRTDMIEPFPVSQLGHHADCFNYLNYST